MTQYTAKKVYIKDEADNYAVPYVNPADTNNLGVVKPDGVTISTASDGTISTNNGNLRAITAYANEGELLTDAQGLSDITNSAHSTYVGDQPDNASPLDPKKFTYPAEHRPNITDDGIASGLPNASNSVYIPKWDTSKPWELQLAINTSHSGAFQFLNATGSSWMQLNIDTTYPFRIILYKSDNTILDQLFSGTSLSLNNWYLINISYDGVNTLTYKDKLLGNSSWRQIVPVNVGDATFKIPYDYLRLFGADSIYDLKHLELTVDGIPVFSGNKTGIDTIKAVDFTAVENGTSVPNPTLPVNNGLTITADGVASGFSGSDYIQTSSINNGNSFNYEGSFITDLSSSSNQYIFATNNVQGVQLVIISSKIYTNIGNGSAWVSGDIAGITTLTNNTKYYYRFIYKDRYYKVFLSTDKENWAEEISWASETNIVPNGVINIGVNRSLGGQFFGSIDLNAFKIYVDGNLVYQPCLKIPYTESKTGSKIVDSIYRDRVNDMASQFGYAPYYTLSDTDFTLPQVELYGNIQQTLRNSTISGVNKNYLYSNRMQIQTGSCTSGVEVTLPTPFSDSNYALTVPYSAKSATAFTPTATGDWIAIGLGNL